MKRTSLVFFSILLTVTSSCGGTPTTVPTGTWKYRLIANGVRVGNAILSNSVSAGNYIITSELMMGTGDVKNISRQIITETLDCKPLKIETYNRIISNGKTQNIDTIATISGREVEIAIGQKKTKIVMDDDFVLDGNYFQTRLVKSGFKKDTEIKGKIYDPSIELEELIPVKTRVEGWESVEVNGRDRRLIHVVQTVESVKSADSYIDGKGVLIKAVIQMLNLSIELVMEE